MIREPSVAGHFYPSNPKVLRRDIESYFDPREIPIEAKAVISPHAGYMYSGGVAGAVFSAVQLPERFIILGPNHTGAGSPLALAPAGEWRTPLGMAAVDAGMNQRLLEGCGMLREDRPAHAREHSLEVQIPFLQTRVQNIRFAAICVGTSDYASLEALGHALARVIQGSPEPVLMVCSSDMNHYESAEVASVKDHLAIDRILALDPPGLHKTVRERHISMCGFAPAVAVLIACRDLRASSAKLVRYANSGEVSGDYGSVVGYAGLAIA